MSYVMRTAMAAIVAALAAGAGPAAASPGEAPGSTATGWVIDNPRPDHMYDIYEGSATIVRVASGATISCPLTSGWGWAESGTVRPQDWFGTTGFTLYGGGRCTGAGGADVEIISPPDMVLQAETYDAESDRISGIAFAGVWGLFLDAPDCQVHMYAQEPNAPTGPITYDNRTARLDTGPLALVVFRADGAGCAGLADVGDEMSFQTTIVATPGFTVRPA